MFGGFTLEKKNPRDREVAVSISGVEMRVFGSRGESLDDQVQPRVRAKVTEAGERSRVFFNFLPREQIR